MAQLPRALLICALLSSVRARPTATGVISTLVAEASAASVFGVCADSEGNVVFTLLGANVIKKLWANGSISVLAGSASGIGGSTGDGGPASAALLYSPIAATVDPTTGALESPGRCLQEVMARVEAPAPFQLSCGP